MFPHLRIAVVVVLFASSPATAEYVIPQMGGGQVGQGAAPMKHADITFDGTNLAVQVDDTVPTPQLRALEPPYEFDPSMPWNVLIDKAYNFQYGWNPGGFITLPTGSWIWIEQLAATPGLEVYQRPPAAPTYAPIFGTGGSPSHWRWSGAMTHNAYAVLNPTRSMYEATYRVYIGDTTTGDPWPAYAPAEVPFHWTATPLLAGDFNDNGVVDAVDYVVWRNNLGTSNVLPNDTIGGTITTAQFNEWRAKFDISLSNGSLANFPVPEPATGLLLGALVVGLSLTRPAATVNRRASHPPVRKLWNLPETTSKPKQFEAEEFIIPA